MNYLTVSLLSTMQAVKKRGGGGNHVNNKSFRVLKNTWKPYIKFLGNKTWSKLGQSQSKPNPSPDTCSALAAWPSQYIMYGWILSGLDQVARFDTKYRTYKNVF